MTLGGSSPAWGQELLVHDGSNTNSYIPIYGMYADDFEKHEFIYPAADLTSLNGKKLKGLKFYSSTTTKSWGTARFKIFLKEVENVTHDGTFSDADATVVCTDYELNIASGEMNIEFSTDYTYNGGNLLVGIYCTTEGTYSSCSFYGEGQSYASACYKTDGTSLNNITTGTTQQFIPKTTFVYQVEGPALSVYDGDTKLTTGCSYNFGLALDTATKEFKLKNPGTTTHTMSVKSTTGGYTAEISNSGSLTGNGEITLTIGMSSTGGEGSVVIESSSDAVDDFTINLNGTIRDPNKMWCDFTSGLPSGWSNPGSWTILTTGADGITSGGGFARNTAYNSNKLIYTPLVTIAEGEKLYFMAKGHGSTASWNVLKVQYSADGTNWTDAKDLTGITNTWQSVEVTEIPAGNWYIGFYGSYAYFTDIYGGTESTAPIISLSQDSYDFGLISSNTTSPSITITNTGKSELTGLSVTSNNANFTVAVADNATTIPANNGTATFTVTMAPNATGAQNATITITGDGIDDLTFTATGAVAKPGTITENFNNNQIPDRWTNSSSPKWTFADENAYAGTTSWDDYATMTTPKIKISEGDFLAVKVKLAYEGNSYGLIVKGSNDDGSTWTAYTRTINTTNDGINNSDYKTVIVSGIPTSVNKLQFMGYYCYVDEIAGLTYAPVLVVKDAEEATQTTGLTYPFGEISANQTVSYTFTNAGAGTINITNVESSNAKFTTNFDSENKPAVTSAAPFTLTITANYDAESAGEQNGAITVTTSEGDFVINLTSTFMAANAPTLTVDNTLNFGKLTANDTQTVTVTNSGTGSMTVNIASDNALFTVSPAQLTEIGAGQSKTFDVTFHYDEVAGSYGNKSANITVTPTYDAEAAIVIAATAKAKDPEEWGQDFSGNALPDGWDVSGNTEKWTFENGVAKSSYSSNKGYLETPLLSVAENDVLSFQAKSTFNGSVTIKVYKKVGSGEWENNAFKTISLTSADNGIWKDYTIEGLDAGNYKFRFENEDYELDNFEGLKLVQAPEFSVYSDNSYTNEKKVTMAEATDFGFVDEEKTVAYYIKNTGHSTMKLAAPVALSPLTASFSDASVGVTETGEGDAKRWNIPADGTIKLNIIMSNSVGGNYTNKTVTVTADDEVGAFVASFSGIVTDNDHYNIDFASTGIPNDWADDGEYSHWAKNNAGYISTTGSSNLTTTALVATTGDKLYIQRESSALTVKYKKQADNDFTTLQALTYTANKKIDELTMPDGLDADKIQLQFSGSGAKIYRIYGLTEPHEPKMSVSPADESYDFGMQTAATAQEFIVTNSGNADLAGVTAELTGTDAADYQVALSVPDGSSATISENVGTVPAGQTLKVTVTMKASTKYKAHNATLTISSTSDGIDDKVITLTGKTRDAAKQYVDFTGLTEFPAGWTAGTSWNIYTSSEERYAYQSNISNSSALRMAPMTVAENETLKFQAGRYYSGTAPEFKVRYTTDGGVTWTEQDYASQLTSATYSTLADLELNGVPAGKVVVEFYGRYVKLDNIYGFTAGATTPIVEVTENTNVIENGADFDFGSNLQAEPAAKVFTLTNNGNANLVSTIASSGDVNFEITETTGTKEGNTVTLANGETATISVTLPYNQANVGNKEGAVTITSTGGVGTFTLNFTGNTIDPTALSEELASLPAGWYNGGWTVDGSAHIFSGVEKELITELYGAEASKNVLSFKAKAQSGNEGTLKVYTSTDRKNWGEATEFALTNEYVTKSLDALADGNYYVKFVSLNANIDDLSGLKKLDAPAHDLYVSASNIPTATKVPGTEITATATVYSLRAAETDVYAKLFFDEELVATADAQDISLNGNKSFTLTGNVPATEKSYAAKIVVYYSDNNVAFETLTTNVEVEHTRTLNIATFTRTDGDGALDADVNNQVSPSFSVTVENTGTTAGTPNVKIYQGETIVATATAAEPVAAGATSDAIALTATNMSAGEGGELAFTAKAFWTAEDPEAKATSASNIVITVNAAAPKFALYDSEQAAVANETAVEYGLTRTKIDKTFTIKNEGTKALVLTSIVVPEGFTATAVTNENKNIAIDGELEITISLDPTEGLGKKNGNVVITYDVNGIPATFTLAVSGRSIGEDTWVEQFDAATVPASWTDETEGNSKWSIYNNQLSFTNNFATGIIYTPRLKAAANEELTYDVVFPGSSNSLVVEWSTDHKTWTNYETVTTEGEHTVSFTEAKEGIYLRFTSSYVRLDNFIGFELNALAHDVEITAENVPTTGKKFNTYTATVTLKENAGKAEAITAKLYVNGADVNADVDIDEVAANSTAVVTLTWEPQATMDDVDTYVQVTYAGGTLETQHVDLTIDEVYSIDEEVGTVSAVTNETIILKRDFVQGWNTICLPFAISGKETIESLFGVGALVFNFKSYTNNVLDFEAITEMSAAVPYLIYVPVAITEDIRVNNVTITGLNSTPGTKYNNGITFRGTYEPLENGELNNMYGVTPNNVIAKGNATTTMKGFRAYFDGNLAGARISIYDETTGITRVYDAADMFGDNDKVYNLKGQRVNNAKKGVYIVNGKQVVVK